jgi:CheY-like chemotaxis protein
MSSGSSTILLVEDNPNDVLLIQRAFRKANLASALQVVGDGDAAIAYLGGQIAFADRQRFPMPRLMLLDLKLPRRSGFEVLAWLRQHEQMKRLPVVVLSSSRESPDIAKAYDLGANSYLVKPVAPDDLLELVKAMDRYWMTFNEQLRT